RPSTMFPTSWSRRSCERRSADLVARVSRDCATIVADGSGAIMSKTKTFLLRGNWDDSSRLEWLETNGLGGYASSTVSGANTRRYHGLLVAATTPPVGRVVLLSKLDE